ncbi:LysR substrate-binding domain-containing protein [Chitiniphilus purpureus]|uniref:LysR substrate-binding domain-containing protein n=1 Tax=Chitiniphilus purpureus TaxID=2981137 RepID=A0ABY6DP31_9NEIS|nr:LysR substrate-binding domain-containing protein [Chitiniphilus sp. CD1]UXY13663.1 LysR substrate-binding domain-containing protein [Chitiniphilus sp. CD1]
MPTRLPPLSALRAFEAAARLCSFKAAAAELSVTATAISHRIRVLEEDLGCQLFVRKTRAVALTAQGQLLQRAVREGFDSIAAGVAALREPRESSVTVSTTPGFAAKWLVPRLAAFQAAHPGIQLHVHASYQPVDLLAGEADLAVRYGDGRYPGLSAVLLLQNRFAPVASPRLELHTPADLLHQSLIHIDWFRPPALTWADWASLVGLAGLNTQAGFRYSDESHAIQAAVAGQGVALVGLGMVDEEVRLGLLQVPFGSMLDGQAYYVVRPARPPRSEVAQVADWLLRTAQAR